MTLLSVIVISHRHERDVGTCLDSLTLPLKDIPHELIVIDNVANPDFERGIGGMRPSLRILRNTAPQGFAANVNKGAAAATGTHLLILNPDTVFAAGRFQSAIDFLVTHPEAALLGARLLNPDGAVQQSARRFPTAMFLLLRGLGAGSWKRVPRQYAERLLDDPAPDVPQKVDWLFGAFMLMPRKAFDSIGGMDESYRLYYEDVDLCLRLRRKGYEMWLYPPLVFVHSHRRESAKAIFSRVRMWHLKSALRYFWRSGSFLGPPEFD